jgi:hypothetical protein
MAEDGGSQPLFTAMTSPDTPRFDVPPRSNASKKTLTPKRRKQ